MITQHIGSVLNAVHFLKGEIFNTHTLIAGIAGYLVMVVFIIKVFHFMRDKH